MAKKKRSVQQTIRRAAGRASGPKKKGGLKREERANIVHGLGRETDPTDLWQRSTVPQRRRWKRTARARGVTVQGLLSGGQRALQERSSGGMRRQARKDADLAYAAPESALDSREAKAKNLAEKETADAERFDLWMAGEQSRLEASAKGADEALRSRYDAIAAAQNAGFDEGGADDAASTRTSDYAQKQVDLAKTAAAGATGAAARDAERAIASRQATRGAFAQSTLTANVNRRYELDSRLHEELRAIAQDRKELSLSKTADVAKELARLRDQGVEVAQANRESQMLGRELGLKAYEARSERMNDRATNRLNWKKYKADLTDDQIRRALDRVKVQIAAGELSRKERADAERARSNLQQELISRERLKSGGQGGSGPGGREWSEGAKNRWGQVINLQGHKKPPEGTPKLLWEAARALKRGGLTYDLYRRLVEANVAVPRSAVPRPRQNFTGPR